MTTKIFTPTTLAVLCSSVVSSLAMASSPAPVVADDALTQDVNLFSVGKDEVMSTLTLNAQTLAGKKSAHFSGTINASANNNAVNVSGTVTTITNSGTLDASASNAVHGLKVNGSQASVDTISNEESGQIKGNWSGVTVENGAHVGTFDNAGTISANKQNGFLVNGSGSDVDLIKNSGTITASQGIVVQNQSNVDSIENTGHITTSHQGLVVDNAKVDSFTNASGASLTSSGKQVGSYGDYGVRVTKGEISSFTNQGNVAGSFGMVIQNGTVGKIVNSGTITGNNAHGIYLAQWYGKSHIDSIENSGTIEGKAGNGITLEPSATIDSITTSGKIIGSTNGISNVNHSGTSETRIGSITVQDGGEIIANGGNGINWTNMQWSGASIGAINIQSGGKITATGSGMWFAGGTNAGKITVDGTVSGASGISNDGQVNLNGSGFGISVGSTGQVIASKNVAISNSGLITGGINVAGTVSGANYGIRNTGDIKAAANQNAIHITGKVNKILNTKKISATSGGVHGIKVAGSGALVESIENSGSNAVIEGAWNGVSIEAKGQVNTITNSGSITGNKNSGILVTSATAGTITNSGTISGASAGINLAGSQVNTINTSGIISSNHQGIVLAGSSTVQNLNIQSGAKVTAMGSKTGSYGDVGILAVGSTVENLQNAGDISGAYGLLIKNSKVGSLVNNGTITGNNADGLYLAQWYGKSRIDSLVNTGTIEGKAGNGITLEPSASIGNLTTSGKIIGSTNGISNVFHAGTTVTSIDNLTVADGGLIEGKTGNGINWTNGQWKKASIGQLNVQAGGAIKAKGSGVWFQSGTEIGTVNVDGSIEGANGIYNDGVISSKNSGYGVTVGATGLLDGSNGYGLANTGKIEGGVTVAGKVSGTKASIWNKGVFEAADGGMALNIKGRVDSIVNDGTLDATTNEDAIHGLKVSQIISDVGTITNNKTIKGNWVGVAIEDRASVDSLVNKGTISGTKQYGVLVGQTASLGKLQNTGTISGKTAGIMIAGNLGDSNTQGVALDLASGSSVTATSGYAVQVSGTINGDINLAGNMSGSAGGFKNAGTINGNINWTLNEDQDVDFGNINGSVSIVGLNALNIQSIGLMSVEPMNITASEGAQVNVENVTVNNGAALARAVNAQGGLAVADLLTVNNQAVAVDSLTEGSELAQLGFTSSFDSQSQTVQAKLEGASTTGGILGHTMANQSMRRDFFVNTMVDEAVQSAQYNSKGQTSLTTAFVKPYGSADKYNVGGADMSGNTYGLLVGANYIQNNVGVTAFAGYEHGDMDATFEGSNLALQNDTFYVGATGFGQIAQFGQADVFVKSGVKAAFTRNDLDRTLTNTASSAKVNAMDWSANAQIGVNYNVAANSVITPVVGLGFASANIDNFSMTHAQGTGSDRYTLNNITMPYGEVAVNWQQGWTDSLRTNIGAGVRVLFDKNQAMASYYGTEGVKSDYDLSSSYEYVTANLSWKMNAHNEVSVGYTGVFEGNGQSHNMTAKYEYLF